MPSLIQYIGFMAKNFKKSEILLDSFSYKSLFKFDPPKNYRYYLSNYLLAFLVISGSIETFEVLEKRSPFLIAISNNIRIF